MLPAKPALLGESQSRHSLPKATLASLLLQQIINSLRIIYLATSLRTVVVGLATKITRRGQITKINEH